MSYNDLTPICLAIPVKSSGDVPTQASAILKGLTGEEAEFVISGGGASLACFPPTVDVGYNRVTFKTNKKNGEFDLTTEGEIDGAKVSSPITVTEADTGKVLTVTTAGPDFKTSSVAVTLNYERGMKILISFVPLLGTRGAVVLDANTYSTVPVWSMFINDSSNTKTMNAQNHYYVVARWDEDGTVHTVDDSKLMTGFVVPYSPSYFPEFSIKLVRLNAADPVLGEWTDISYENFRNVDFAASITTECTLAKTGETVTKQFYSPTNIKPPSVSDYTQGDIIRVKGSINFREPKVA